MALLTAEDVLNKAFSKTKYREGFDQDEVDDFLDEVANTIAQLTAERDDFAARVANGAPAAPAVAPEAPAATAAGGVPGTTGLLAAATEPGGVNPAGMLAMAQKLHDEYVQAGEAERDRIIDEAHASADQIRERADEDAKSRMDALAGERVDLEGRIDDLRRFERDYRARLKAYLENLLGDLDHAGVAGAAGLAAELPGDDAPAEVAEEWPSAPAATSFEGAVADAAVAEDAAPADSAPADSAPADSYESAEDDNEIIIIDAYEEVTVVSFDEALNGEPAEQPTEFEPATPTNYDATQSWESQLRPEGDVAPANPFAPVTQPTNPEPALEAEDIPGVAAADESHEAPYTPPSTRMFNDLYGQQRPDQGN